MTKRWIGRWLLAIALLHFAVAAADYGTTYVAMAGHGLWNTAPRTPQTLVASWFLLAGVLTFVVGVAIDALERTGRPPPYTLGAALLAFAVAGIVLMPASGFWLFLPAAIALLLRTRQQRLTHNGAATPHLHDRPVG